MSQLPLLSDGSEVTGRDYEDALAAARDDANTLRQKLQRLQTEFSGVKLELAKCQHVIGGLKSQLSPLYHALRGVWGELDLVDLPDGGGGAPTIPSSSHASARGESHVNQRVWDEWKRKLGGKTADIIQSLIEHGRMTKVQMKVAAHAGTSTVDRSVAQMMSLRLLDKDGGYYSLKEL